MGLVHNVDDELIDHFCSGKQMLSCQPFGEGHINDTYLIRLIASQAEDSRPNDNDIVLQRINHHVFPKPEQVMENISRVCQHLASQLGHLPDSKRRHLRIWPTMHGLDLYRDQDGNYWRAYHRILNVRSFQKLETPSQARQVGFSFAEFQSQLSSLPSPRLHETIHNFHNTRSRYQRFLEVLKADSHDRAKDCQSEIDFILAREQVVGRLLDLQAEGKLPERIVHNDTKLNNLLFDAQGDEAICVVDLDTIMPGLVHYDFGDMVRTAANLAPEDEPNTEAVQVSDEIFSQLAQGYLEGGRNFLTDAEVEQLVFSGILMTLEVAIRFLTDHLDGDHYFKIHHPGHNLQRARAQLALVARLEERQSAWETLVQTQWAALRPNR